MALCVVIVGVVWRPVVGPNVGFDSPSRAKTGHVSITAKVEAIDISIDPIVGLSLKDGIKVFPSKRTGEVTRGGESFIWRNRDNRSYRNRTPITRVWWQIGNELAANEYLGDKCRCSAIISEPNDHIRPIRRRMIFRNWADRIESFKEQSGPFAADESFRAGLCGIRRDLCSIGAFLRGFSGNLGLFQCLGSELRLLSSGIEQAERDHSIQNGNNENAPISNRGPLIPFLLGLLLFYGGAWLNYLYWGWLDDDCKRWRGDTGLAARVLIMGAGLILMFFVSASYACGV